MARKIKPCAYLTNRKNLKRMAFKVIKLLLLDFMEIIKITHIITYDINSWKYRIF